MHPLRKALKASDRRRTRFHTERGEIMPPAAWVRLPQSLSTRLRHTQPDAPWMVPAAVELLDQLIEPNWRVLEFGSGASTAWYAARAARVVSFEDDPRWHEVISARIKEAAPSQCELRHVPLHEFVAAAAMFPASSFDLVVVDGNEQPGATRVDCAAVARSLIRPGGFLVLDDSDIREYQPAFEMLQGWPRQRFVGMKHRPLMAVETTIFRRPATDRDRGGPSSAVVRGDDAVEDVVG